MTVTSPISQFKALLAHPDRPVRLWSAAAWFCLLGVPLLLTPYWQLFAIQCMTALIAALGVNVIVGHAGQLALSSVAFVAVGAYVYVYAAERAGSVAVAFAVVILLCGVLGLLVGLLASRLRGLYLAFVTLGVALSVPEALKNLESLTGGAVGQVVPMVPLLPGVPVDTDLGRYLTIAAITSLAVAVTTLLVRTRFGYALDAVRTSEDLVASVGASYQRTVTLAFAYSCVLAGVAGGVYASSVGYLTPEAFGFDMLLLHLTIVVVGGLGSVTGTVTGAAAICLLNEFLRNQPGVSEIANGVALLLVLFFAPGGIVGAGGRVLTRLRRRGSDDRRRHRDAERRPEVSHG